MRFQMIKDDESMMHFVYAPFNIEFDGTTMYPVTTIPLDKPGWYTATIGKMTEAGYGFNSYTSYCPVLNMNNSTDSFIEDGDELVEVSLPNAAATGDSVFIEFVVRESTLEVCGIHILYEYQNSSYNVTLLEEPSVPTYSYAVRVPGAVAQNSIVTILQNYDNQKFVLMYGRSGSDRIIKLVNSSYLSDQTLSFGANICTITDNNFEYNGTVLKELADKQSSMESIESIKEYVNANYSTR